MSSHSWKRVILGIVFLGLSFFYSVIFFQNANFNQTMIFNIAHLKSLGNVFTSPINFNFWNHSGSLINIFSPWLTILSGWLFVNFNVTYGFSLYLGLITFVTLVSAYFYMNRFSNDTFESLLFSVIYAFSLNRFYQIFQQQRLENYLVLIFLPMVYFGAYRFFKNQGWKNLVWGMLLIVWTAPYMAIAVTITLVPMFFLMLFSKRSHHWRYWGRLILNSLVAIGLVFVTTIGFVGPLISQQSQSNLEQNPIKNIDYSKWFNSLDFSKMQLFLLLAIGVLLSLLLLLIFLKSRFSYKVILLEMIPLTSLILVKFQISLVDISRLIPAFQSILDLFVAIVISRILILVFQEGPGVLKLILVTVTVAGFMTLTYQQAAQIHPNKTIMSADKIDYQKFVWNYHDHAQNGQNQFLVNNKKASVSFYTKSNDYWVQYYNPTSADMDLPVQKYSGYKIQLNNENISTKLSKRNTLQLKTQPGKNIIEIHSRYDWIGIVCLLINLFGFIFLGYLSLKDILWKNKKLPENS